MIIKQLEKFVKIWWIKNLTQLEIFAINLTNDQ